ncbi:MAG TPA: DUF1800 domain-containing protein [Vicinamibacterales bacterium]|nr:DUF1800 domain-containing protein [Vicinamibacterales bacterium]
MSHVPARSAAALAALMMALVVQGPGLQASAPAGDAATRLAQPAGSPTLAASSTSVAHVLNRLTYGPRPGDLARVQRMGIETWLDEQLHPERIANRALEARLAGFVTLTLDANTLFRDYHEPAQLERRARQREAAAQPADSAPAPVAAAAGPGGPLRRELSPAQQKDRQVIAEMEQARLLRAVYSERQLEEVLVDFWFNHFNVFAGKGPTRAYVTAFERDAIRPYVLGSFRQMLEAVARSPAMLFYLDNWMNTDPDTDGRRMPLARNVPQRSQRAGVRQTQTRGLNENFARELLELHTLGVDGGYTQEDIVNVARAFTGWTFRPRQDARFQFVPVLHDEGTKTVLGHTIAAGGGIDDGRRVLDILVAHPSTARFIATKLAQKFVSDSPPVALVERAAATFTRTRGDLREVTRVIVISPEFLAPEAWRAKVKTPLEFVASAVRATGADVRTALSLARTLGNLGMPLYFCQPPTGYDETGDTWVSSGALVARMNFALELGGNRLRGVSLPAARATDVGDLREQLIDTALEGTVSDATRATLARATTPDQVVALAIGSPEFQRQ